PAAGHLDPEDLNVGGGDRNNGAGAISDDQRKIMTHDLDGSVDDHATAVGGVGQMQCFSIRGGGYQGGQVDESIDGGPGWYRRKQGLTLPGDVGGTAGTV